MSENNILGVVLAGGKSKRFGEDKSKVKLNGKILLEHTLDKIKSKFDEIIIVLNLDLILSKVCSIKVLPFNLILLLSTPNLLDLPPAKTTPKILFSLIKTNIKH